VTFPTGSQAGVRYGQILDRFEYSVSFYDGFNHLPAIQPGGLDPASATIDFMRVYPAIRSYGADAAVPFRWFTLKTEAAAFTSRSSSTDEYVLYVLQVERQTGEWLLIGGYAGEIVTNARAPFAFAPDRGSAGRSSAGRPTQSVRTVRWSSKEPCDRTAMAST
jgi:hypothetical protein